jgi:predicted RNA-binding Zn-ribbon protein involved in translation (DUF1610 family)
MSDPWKVEICDNPECLAEALDEHGNVKAGHHLLPDTDIPAVVQFTCPRCGTVKTWGKTRQDVAKILYERYTGSA